MNSNHQFTSYAWDNFDIKTCLSILKAGEPSYKGHHEMLIAGLRAWLIAPDDINFRKRSILLKGIEVLAESKKPVIRNSNNQFPSPSNGSDVMIHLDGSFFRDFFYPIGGFSAFKEILSYSESTAITSLGCEELFSVVKFMEILHFYAEKIHMRSDLYPASVNKICKLVEIIYRNRGAIGGTNRTEAKRRLIKHRSATALIYSACRTETKNNKSILAHVVDDTLNYNQHHKYILRWLSRATFVRIKILPVLEYTDDDKINSDLLPLNRMERFSSLMPTSEEERIITQEFDQKLILQNRRRTERSNRISHRGVIYDRRTSNPNK